MGRTVLVMMLLLGVAAHAQERGGARGDPRGTASERVEERSQRAGGEHARAERPEHARAERPEHARREERERAEYRDYVITEPPPGYIITPWGSVIFPDAPPPMGDTSTLSGAGPDVSEGPVVGSGPEVSSGPVVGPIPAGTPLETEDTP